MTATGDLRARCEAELASRVRASAAGLGLSESEWLRRAALAYLDDARVRSMTRGQARREYRGDGTAVQPSANIQRRPYSKQAQSRGDKR